MHRVICLYFLRISTNYSLNKREGFHMIIGQCPKIPRLKRSRVQLGETCYNFIGPTGFGTEYYKEIYEANADGRRLVLKVQHAT